jgi:hypothetical protein
MLWVARYACRPDTFWIPYDNQMTTSGCHPWKPDETPWPHPDQACGHWVWMEDLILLEALTLMVVSYAHFAVSITQEICASPIPLRPIPLGPIPLGSIRLRFSPSLAVRFVCSLWWPRPAGIRRRLEVRATGATAAGHSGPAHVASHALVRCCMPACCMRQARSSGSTASASPRAPSSPPCPLSPTPSSPRNMPVDNHNATRPRADDRPPARAE